MDETNIEERVSSLEKQVDELARAIRGLAQSQDTLCTKIEPIIASLEAVARRRPQKRR